MVQAPCDVCADPTTSLGRCQPRLRDPILLRSGHRAAPHTHQETTHAHATFPPHVAVTAAMLITLLTAGSTAAAPSVRTVDHRVELAFDQWGPDISVSMQLAASNIAADGFNVAIWVAPDSPLFDPPTFVGSAADLAIGAGDASLGGVIALADSETGAAAGTLTINATLSPLGEPQTLATRGGGNHLVVTEQSFQALTVAGTASLAAGDMTVALPLEGASATLVDLTSFENSPSSTVTTTEAFGMLRYWNVDGMIVGMLVDADRDISYLEIAIILPDGSAINGYDEAASVGQRFLEADLGLASTAPGLVATGGSAEVRGELARIDRTRTVVEDGDDRSIVTLDEYALHGTLVLELNDGTTHVIPLEDGSGRFLGYRQQAIDGGRAG